MKMNRLLAVAALAAALLAVPAAAQTTDSADEAVTPLAPPDVSRITIRRPSGDVVEPGTYRRPLVLPPEADGDLAAEGDGPISLDDAANFDALEGFEGRIVRQDGPGIPGAPIGGVPNTTAVDVNDPGVRIRIPPAN